MWNACFTDETEMDESVCVNDNRIEILMYKDICMIVRRL